MRNRRKQRRAETHPFKEKVHAWAKKIRVQPEQVRVQAMKRKWASCSTQGWVTFAEDLLQESTPFQDYVIVHELLHLKVPNHGKLFKSYLSAYMPGWKQFTISCQSSNQRGGEGSFISNF